MLSRGGSQDRRGCWVEGGLQRVRAEADWSGGWCKKLRDGGRGEDTGRLFGQILDYFRSRSD